MRPPDAERGFEYLAGPAAKPCLDGAASLRPDLNRQALLDMLVIYGYSAMLHTPWTKPALFGTDRTKWRPITPETKGSDQGR